MLALEVVTTSLRAECARLGIAFEIVTAQEAQTDGTGSHTDD